MATALGLGRVSVVQRPGDEPGLASGGIVVTRRFWVVPAALMAAMLATFVVVEVVGVEPLTDPNPLLGAGGAVAAVAGTALLVADVFLPVPSSGVMLAHGALFGIVAGAALSLLGSLGAFAVGFRLGKSGSQAVGRLVSEESGTVPTGSFADGACLRSS